MTESLTRRRGWRGRGARSRSSCSRSRRWRGRRGRRGRGCRSGIRCADPGGQEADGALILALCVGGKVRLDSSVIAYGIAAECFAHVVDDSVDVLFVVCEEFLERGAKVLRVGAGAGVVRVGFDAAGEDLLFEAVEATRDALEVERAAEGRGDGLLSRESQRFERIAKVQITGAGCAYGG